MENFMLFLSSFCSYLVKYIAYIIAIVAACFIGIGLRKNSNKKNGVAESTEAETEETKATN